MDILNKNNIEFIKTEVVNAVTVFMTILYVLVLNSNILCSMGQSFEQGFFATVFMVALGTFVSVWTTKTPGVYCSYLGETTFCSYILYKRMGLSLSQILFCAFISALIFMLLSFTKLRFKLLDCIPSFLKSCLTVSVGIFLMMIALSETKLIKFSSFGFYIDVMNIFSYRFLFFLVCILLICLFKKFRFNIILAILVTFMLGYMTDQISPNFSLCNFSILESFRIQNFFESFDLSLKIIVSIFSLIILLFCDTNSIIIVIKEIFGLSIENQNRINKTDAINSILSPFLGTISCGLYPESILLFKGNEKSESTFSNLLIAILFLITIPFIRFIESIPSFIVNGILFYIGLLLSMNIKDLCVKIKSREEYIPSILLILLTIMTLNISFAFCVSFISFFVIEYFKCNSYRNILSVGLFTSSILFVVIYCKFL